MSDWHPLNELWVVVPSGARHQFGDDAPIFFDQGEAEAWAKEQGGDYAAVKLLDAIREYADAAIWNVIEL